MAMDTASNGGEFSRHQHAPAYEETREDEVTNLMEIARKLCLVEDPDQEPFRSKYKAREALTKARQSLVSLLSEDGGDLGSAEAARAAAAATGRMALIDYRLGVIALAVEENSAAQEALDKCADVFFDGLVGKIAAAAGNEDDDDEGGREGGKTADSPPPPPTPTAVPPGVVYPCPLAWDHPEEAADTLTQLGLLWSARGHARRSILYLLASVDFLRQASSALSRSPPPPPPPSSLSPPPSNGSVETETGEGEKEEMGVAPQAAGSVHDGGTVGHVSGPVAGVGVAAGEEKSSEKQRQQQLRRKDKETNLESMLTHAFYFLAQAYGMRDVEQSAKYCALTLQRQLDASQRGDGEKVSFDPGEWSRNACFLADYYSGLGRFPEAGRCLLAAQAVLQPERPKHTGVVGADGSSSPPLSPPRAPLSEGGQNEGAKEKKGEQKEQEEQINSGVRQEGKDETKNAKYRDGKEGQSGLSAEEREQKGHPKNEGRSDEEEKSEGKQGKEEETEEEREKRTEQRADVDRHMAKLYIMVLQAKHQERSRSGGGEFSRVPTGDTDDEKEDGFLSGFASLGIGELPMCDPSAVPGDFESVRDVFKKAKSHTERALKHYVLDGFVTAHVALQQGLSRAYLHLSAFEPDAKRRQAMCSRRAQALEPLLAVLAPKAYAHLHKELSFELGEIYQDLADIKVLRIEEKVSSGVKRAPAALASDLRSTNKLLKSAIDFFSHFVAMYHEGDPEAGAASSRSQPAKGMEPAEAVGYLQARFMRARLNGKLQPLTSEKELHALRLSCVELEWLSEHARGHLKAAREAAGDPGIFEQELELAEEMAQLQRRNIANLERKMGEQKRAQA